MITTVTLNPAIDREYFLKEQRLKTDEYLYDEQDIRVFPGGKGLITAIDLKILGYSDVQNIGFVGGKQGPYFESMVQEYKITTNYIYTEDEIRNNIFIISKDAVTFTRYSDYTYEINKKDVETLLRRFKRAIVDSDLIIIAGSIPKGVDFDIYQKMVEACNELGKDVFLQASGEALNLALKEKPKVVNPYFKHTRKILDREVIDFEDFVSMGHRLLEEGAQSVVIPYNTERLLFFEDKVYSLSTNDLCLENWLGAGDAYMAGFYDYVAREGFDFIEANRYGEAALLTVAENRSIYIESRDLVEKNMKRIVVKELEV